ncbi:MAG TPA: sulfotransferase [Acidimicrobiales bacterium]|nr:sulfotransferase [Acidimicrobiales bacterium]
MDAKPESIYDAFVAPRQRAAPFDPSDSPLFERVAFIVGAPRSGTTWLQQLLYTHPDVATGGESHLFCEGLPAIFDNLAHPNGMSHLSTWASRTEVLGAARQFCDRIFESQRRATRPDARYVLEKTPNHRLQAALQTTLYPDARYIHIVRDGRDVTASQRQLWGEVADEFADAEGAARAWSESIRDIREHAGALAYLELRYEELVSDTAGGLRAIFEHLALAFDETLVGGAAEFGRAPVHTSPLSPHVGIRKHAGDAPAERAVASVAGDLLVELGYATADEVAQAANAPIPRRRMRDLLGQRRSRGDQTAVRRAVDETAEALVAETSPEADLRGARLTQRRVVGNAAMLTFVTSNDERVVLRVVVESGAAATIERL